MTEHNERPSTPPSLMPPLRVAQLSGRRSVPVTLAPDAEARAQIAAYLGLEGLRKFRFEGALKPLRRDDWELVAQLGATITQSCAVTLTPVSTRIDEEVRRSFIADLPEPEGVEIEMPEDDTVEPLGAEIDISALAIEALSLAMPAFVRSEGARLSESGKLASDPPGATPLAEGRPNPFKALESLKAQLAARPEPKLRKSGPDKPE